MKSLISIEERKWIAANATVLLGPERGIKYPVVDLKKLTENLKQEIVRKKLAQFVDIIPIKENPYKNIDKSMTFEKDPETGVYYGIATGLDNFGNIKWQKINVRDQMRLILTREADLQVWAIIRFWSEIQGSPFQKSLVYFKVYDPIDAANSEMEEMEALEEAFEHISSIKSKPRKMLDLVRYLGAGNVFEGINSKILNGYLIKEARTNPFAFNEKWKEKDRGYAELLASAVSFTIIRKDPEGGYFYNNVPLGISEEETIRFLKTDSNISQAIRQTLDEQDIFAKALDQELTEKKAADSKKTDKITAGPGDDETNDFQ